MANERHYFLVGMFVLGGVAAILFFTLWLTSRDDSKYRPYFIRFAESVSGLSVGSDVKFRGVKVGAVTALVIDPDDSRLIRVDISLLKTTPVKTDTKANLKLQGITGTVFIELSGGEPGTADLARSDDEKQIPEIPAEQSSLNALIDRVPILLDKISAMVDRLNNALSDENLASVHHMLKNGDEATTELKTLIGSTRGTLQQNSDSVASTMQHINSAARRVDRITEKVEEDPSALIFPPEENGIPAP